MYTHTSTEAERGAAQALEQETFGNLFRRQKDDRGFFSDFSARIA
jgi:hypothetical protein